MALVACLLLSSCTSSPGVSGDGEPDRCEEIRCAAGERCDPLDGSCKREEPPACGGVQCADGEICDRLAERCREPLADRCVSGDAWKPGTPAFREVTAAWKLEALGVEGVRLSVADVDGDGFPDLFVRRGGTSADDFAPGGQRSNWLLRNVRGAAFEDITEASGLLQPRRRQEARVGRPAEVTVWADVNNDGFIDAFTGSSDLDLATRQLESSEVMLNDGKGRFVLGPEESAPRREGEAVSVAGAAFIDINRDGIVDLFVASGAVNGRPAQDRLYRGYGDGDFGDVTEEAGLLTVSATQADDLNLALAHSNAWGALACDLNGDGAPELLVPSYGRAPNHLWQATGAADFRFVNRSIDSGYAFDARDDWSGNESARCWCKLHPGDEGCEGVPAPEHIRCVEDGDAFRWNHASDREPYRLGGNSGTTVCADVNNDGFLDLLTTEIVHWDVGASSDPSELLFNDGAEDVRFRRPGGEATGLKRTHDRLDWNDGDMTAAVFDFDNDGRPDIYIGSSDYPGTRGHLYHQGEDGVFVEVPIEWGIDHRSSHGIAVADFDRDGDLDVVVGHSRTRCGDHCYEKGTPRFFENLAGTAANWIQLDLVGGPKTNRAAIGARITVRASGVTQTQEVGGGHGHYGIQHDRVAHFGLGAACEAEVTIRWPDRELSEQHFTVQAGYRYRIVQGEMPMAEG